MEGLFRFSCKNEESVLPKHVNSLLTQNTIVPAGTTSLEHVSFSGYRSLFFFFLRKSQNQMAGKMLSGPSTHGAKLVCLCSPSTFQVDGVSPSDPCAQRESKSDVATAFATAHDNMTPQRTRHACSARFCRIAVSCRAFALANWVINVVVSPDHRPAHFHGQHHAGAPTCSRYVRSLRRLAACSTTPSASAAVPCKDASQWQTKVVSTAN